jgi:aminoglycoside phosphotransferase (APT) family kinase protein
LKRRMDSPDALSGDVLAWALDAALAAPTTPTVVTRLPGGQRHRVFLVVTGETKIVVRQRMESDAAAVAKTRREIAVLRCVGETLGPRLLAAEISPDRFGSSVTCLEYVDGAAVPRWHGVARAASLGSALRSLHALPPPRFADSLPIENRVGNLSDHYQWRVHYEIARRRQSLPSAPEWVDAAIEKGQRAIQANYQAAARSGAFSCAETSLLHGDAAGNNVLWRSTRSPVLIDWEDARLGDPAEEIAYALSENRLPPDARTALLDAYVTGEPAAFLARVQAWMPLVALGSSLWWVCRAATASLDVRTRRRCLQQARDRLSWISA